MLRIPLSNGLFALISDEDAHLASKKWYARRSGHTFYAQRMEDRRMVTLHRVVAGAVTSEQHVDHINRDGLDNRRENLRLVTRSENMRNRRGNGASGIAGVFFRKDTGRWLAHIQLDGHHKSLGCFDSIEEAAEARKRAEDAWWSGERSFEPADQLKKSRDRVPGRNNTSGARGISQRKSGKWIAYINEGDKRFHLGTFDTFEAALAKRQQAEAEAWGLPDTSSP